tara:strand:+ start:127 stop:480 length:354 start_codon:yes stop_codon:yes gene_type:complete
MNEQKHYFYFKNGEIEEGEVTVSTTPASSMGEVIIPLCEVNLAVYMNAILRIEDGTGKWVIDEVMTFESKKGQDIHINTFYQVINLVNLDGEYECLPIKMITTQQITSSFLKNAGKP